MGEFKVIGRASGSGAFKELNRVSGSGAWKTLEWESAGIDVGGACINGISYENTNYTLLSVVNPANIGGVVTDVCIWMASAGSIGYIGIFHECTGNLCYKCRSAVNVGSLSLGENNITGLSLSIVAGDLIGFYCAGSYLDKTTVGDGYYYRFGNHCVVDDEDTYGFINYSTLSLHGTG